MWLIDYLKKEMKIRRPFLFILTAGMAFMVGASCMYAVEGSKVTKLRETISEVKQEMVRKEAEWAKKLKDKTRTIKVTNADGSSREEIFNDLEVDEAGAVRIDVSKLASKLRLVESEYNSLPWSVKVRYAPPRPLTGNFSVPDSKLGVELSRDVFDRWNVGVFADYDGMNDQWWVGLSVGVNF